MQRNARMWNIIGEGSFTMRNRLPGFTIMELLVTIAILSVVMSLLIFPIFSAWGYIQKAQANVDAQNVGDQVVRRLKSELSTAAYIFELPPDGTMITFVPGNADGTVMNSDGTVAIVRYSQVLDFPWEPVQSGATTPPWRLLKPNYLHANPAYDSSYSPFWHGVMAGRNKVGTENPYLITRFAESSLSWDIAQQYAADGSYPMNTWDTGDPRSVLLRKFRNGMVALTPINAQKWDAPRFQVTPLRVVSETLPMPVDTRGQKNPTLVRARYPLWAGHNTDLSVDDNPLDPSDENPFGYTIRVFDESGGIVYGNNSAGVQTDRHFIDWPLRPVSEEPNATDCVLDRNKISKADVDRQRLEGKLVFALPVSAKQLTVNDDFTLPDGSAADGRGGYLPAPWGALNPWDTSTMTPSLVYLVSRPRHISISGKTFRLVDKLPTDLAADEYCFIYKDYKQLDQTTSTWQWESRAVAFGSDMPTGTVAITAADYTVCDLQPTDVVVGTYSTKGVLDVAVTVSRRDSAGRTPAQRRQDFSANVRIVARNAVKHARSSQ